MQKLESSVGFRETACHNLEANKPARPASIIPGKRMLEVFTGVQTPDETLVRLARGGDNSAREELFRRYRSDAYRYAYRQLGHEQDALDVVQESMLKAFSGLADFDGRSAFRTWLLRIVINTAFDWGRRRKTAARWPGW